MSFYVIICTDKVALLSSGAVDEEGPYRGLIDGKSGAYVLDNADASMSMIVMTDIDGVEPLGDLPFIIVTSYEEIYGYISEGVEIEGDPDLKALYDEIFPEGGLFAVPGGQDVSHILVGQS